MARILFYGSCWPTNIGNAFVNLGAMKSVSLAVGDSADVMHVGGLSSYLFQTRGVPKNNLNIAEMVDCDYVVMGGMTQCVAHFQAAERTIAKFLENGTKIVIAGGGAEFYNDEEVEQVRGFMERLPIYAFVSRDTYSYQQYHDLATHSLDGIDSAFFISQVYQPIPLQTPAFCVVSFDSMPEPTLMNLSDEQVAADDMPESQASVSRLSALKNIPAAAKAIVRGKPSPVTIDVEGRLVFRTHHSAWPPAFRDDFFERDHTMISDLPSDYLTLYSQAHTVYSDRVHACIAALSFGSRAHLFGHGYVPRLQMFDRVGVGNIMETPVNIDSALLAEERRRQVDFFLASIDLTVSATIRCQLHRWTLMQFDPEALSNKQTHLDSILDNPDVLNAVIAQNMNSPFSVENLPRVWEPGGGATLFHIEGGEGDFLLKVKDRSVWVESKLESEEGYLRIPSLQNEYDFLQRCQDRDWAPNVRFFDEAGDYQFLAVEWLATFDTATRQMSVHDLLAAWQKIVDATRWLYSQGMVHTDIHEHNICFRGNQPVLCDFEETRYLKQDVPFEESLDMIGVNRYGDLGEFPKNHSKINGRTCLYRLRQVFRGLVLAKLPTLLEGSNFDDSCPFNLDELQERDTRVYQSIDFPDIQLAGQRPEDDPRLTMFAYLMWRSSLGLGKKLVHIDIGSNMGAFCFEAARYPFVNLSIGLEAYDPYVDVAKTFRFLYDFSKTRLFTFVCGDDKIEDLLDSPTLRDLIGPLPDIDFVTMLSVYHHIPQKDALLADLKRVAPKNLLVEFATQERYYPERSGVEAEIGHIRETLGFRHAHRLAVSRDYRRPLVLFTDRSVGRIDRIAIRLFFSRYKSVAKRCFLPVARITG